MERNILRLLDRYSLTPADLYHSLALADDQEEVLHSILLQMLKTGLIVELGKTSWSAFFMPRLSPQGELKINQESAYTLTMKGYFRLHPLIEWHR